MDERIGTWAFILGVIIAILAAFIAVTGVEGTVVWTPWITLLLVILGLIVGFLNIGDKEITGFLIASIALMALSSTNAELLKIEDAIPFVGTILQKIVLNIAIFVAPAALIVALMEIYKLASGPKGTVAKIK